VITGGLLGALLALIKQSVLVAILINLLLFLPVMPQIRTEVQSIYARLGKLTPYYKQHCETILFEVGKLYEMLREARETEMAMESKPEEQAPASEGALDTVEKKDRS
jgi:hypothetical protein